MEKINNISIIKNKDTENLENLEHDKEFIFDTLILAEIVDSFIVDLEEAGFEKEEVDEFLEEINKYDNEAIKGILAIPKELRGKNFVRYKEEIDNNKNTIAKIGNNTEHKRDTSNNWGRASSLSIIHKIDLAKIDEKVEERIKQAKEEIRRDAA